MVECENGYGWLILPDVLRADYNFFALGGR